MFTLQEIRPMALLMLIFLTPTVWADPPLALTARTISYSLCSNCSDCTGFFLNEKTILTAAHCPENTLSPLKRTPWRNEKGLVLSTKNIWTSKTRHVITDYTLHPGPLYNKGTRQNDVMIIKLKSNVILPQASPAPLFTSTNDLKGTFWARGFGGRKTPINSKIKKMLEKSRILHLEFKWLEQSRIY